MDAAVLLPDFQTFSTVAEKLRSAKVRSFHDHQNDLAVKKNQVKIILGARESGLAKAPELKTLACSFDDAEYCGTVLELLYKEFPLIDSMMEDYGNEGDVRIIIQTLGFAGYTEDDADSVLEGVNAGETWYSLTAFLLLQNWMIEDWEVWEKCIEAFAWPFEEPVNIQWSLNIDKKYLKRALKKHGAEDLYSAAQQALFPPDNAFLLANFNDDSSICFDFTAESIEYLRKEWKKAQPYFEQFDRASELVMNDPSLLRILIDALVESQNHEWKPRKRITSVPNLVRDADPEFNPDNQIGDE